MADCCELPSSNTTQGEQANPACPACGKPGQSVPGQTVKALLAVSLQAVKDVEYHFCKTQSCPVVYYSPDGTQIFTTAQVRELVYQKEPDREDVFICYCFHYKIRDLRSAGPETRARILEAINAGTRSGQCACDLRNPQGSCCLGNVRRLVQRLAASSANPKNSESG